MDSYIFKIELQEEEDKRWSVWVPTLLGCTSWGYSKDEALRNIQEAVQCHIEAMLENGEPIPSENADEVDICVYVKVQINNRSDKKVFLDTAGAWVGSHDSEELKRNIYADRLISTREEPKL